MRGATYVLFYPVQHIIISTHTPHAGRDYRLAAGCDCIKNFYSHAPCGARQKSVAGNMNRGRFLLTRPMRGATQFLEVALKKNKISTHTPHAGRDGKPSPCYTKTIEISTHTPHAGRDFRQFSIVFHFIHFYSHAPCGARHITTLPVKRKIWISTHTPHAGRDHKIHC